MISTAPMLQMLAEGNFDMLAERFAQAGFAVSTPEAGMIVIRAPGTDVERSRLLVSIGIHGDETAPIEMMADILTEFVETPRTLAVDLMIVVGNLAAITQASRFVEVDMNRLFTSEHRAMASDAETHRTTQIMEATERFFVAGAGRAMQWHLDLHSTIRPSLYARFAIVPVAFGDGSGDELSPALGTWLASAGIEALVFNSLPSSTYSAFSARLSGVEGVTLELGTVSIMGKNSLDHLEKTRDALSGLMKGSPPSTDVPLPICFSVSREIRKVTASFDLRCDPATANFTEIAAHTVIATDGSQTYATADRAAHLLFPNPNVAVGQRAGLLLYRTSKKMV